MTNEEVLLRIVADKENLLMIKRQEMSSIYNIEIMFAKLKTPKTSN